MSFSNNSIKIKTELFLSFFVISALFAYFVCMSVAVPSAIRAGNVNYLFYSKLSSIIKGPHHLSYSVLFAIVLLAFSVIGQLNLFIQKSAKLTVFKLLSLIFLVVFLLQLSSKVTILFLFLFSIAFFVYLVRKKIISFTF